MLKTIKYITKLIELSNNKEEINKYSLEIYSILLGYFSKKKDNSVFVFNENETLKELEKRILELTNIKYYKILGASDNYLDSFNIFIKNINNDKNNNISELLKKNFYNGYNYCDYFYNKYNSLFDYIILHKHERLEYKLKKYI